jgi:hypothetical protein
MAGPLAGISAAQIAQQKVQEQSAQQTQKQGPSKFDQALKTQGADKAQGPQGVGAAQATEQAQATRRTDFARQVDAVRKSEKAELNKVNTNVKNDNSVAGKAMDPVTHKAEVSKGTSMVMGMMNNMEKGQVAIDKLINGGLTGKHFSNGELLSLQAGMYKYTQELELTGKVVEKATTGLKDTLKTQV